MAVRVYRVNILEHKEQPSFTTWYHKELFKNLVHPDIFCQNTGIIEIEVNRIEQEIQNLKDGKYNFEQDEVESIIEQLEDDLAFAKKEDKEYLLYDLF